MRRRAAGCRSSPASLVLIALAILISLGTWQVERLHWKEGLIADIAERRGSAPVPLADIEAMAGSGRRYRIPHGDRVPAAMCNNKERHFFATWHGQTGYYVYTPLQLADGRYLFVNRGFVPYENKEPEMRMQGQLTGEQTVTGLARDKLPGKPSWAGAGQRCRQEHLLLEGPRRHGLERRARQGERRCPFSSMPIRHPIPAGLPIGGVTQVDLPNNHLQYAFTWYGLAARSSSWSRSPGSAKAARRPSQ